MNPVLQQMLETQTVLDEDGRSRRIDPASVPAESGQALADLIAECRARNTIEIGCAYGVSTLFMCQTLDALGNGLHTAIDPLQTSAWGNAGRASVDRAGLTERFRFFEEPAHVQLPRLLDAGERFDFAFIDGLHLFDYTLVEFFYLDKMIDVESCIVLDDVWMDSTQQAVDFITSNLGYQRRPWPAAGNLAVLHKYDDRPRAWDFHVRF